MREYTNKAESYVNLEAESDFQKIYEDSNDEQFFPEHRVVDQDCHKLVV